MTSVDRSELISVIMPAHNSARTLESAAASVLDQTHENLELLIVDDASSDNTPEICRALAASDDRVRVISNTCNMGALRSRLKAAKEAKADWIAFLDSDDLWKADKLTKQLAVRDDAGCDIVYTGSAFMNESGQSYEWIMHVPDSTEYKKLLKQNIISNSSVLVNKDAFIRFAPDEGDNRVMHEDFACWLGMLRSGLTARGIDEPLITYRISKGSKSGSKINASSMNMNTYEYLGLGFFSRLYYQMCYSVNGLKKYRHFR